MTQPSYKIELINEKVQGNAVVTQATVSSRVVWGASIRIRMGQTFQVPNLGGLVSIAATFATESGSTSTDTIQAKLYAADKTTLLDTAINTVSVAGLPTHPNKQQHIFIFNKVILVESTTYFVEFSRTGAAVFDLDIYGAGNVYADGTQWQFNGTVWTDILNDAGFIITLEQVVLIDTTDISDDVDEILSINTGLNEVYGSIKQGEALLRLDNGDSKYSPLNSSSSLFGKFRVNNRMQITATFNAVDYILFTGIISNITPDLLFVKRTVSVRLLDVLSRLKELKVSIGLQSGKRVSDIITTLTVAAGLLSTEVDIQTTDPTILADVTYDDVNLLDTLNALVQAGQHYHFVSGDGKYTFKTNQFLSNNIPLFLYTAGDPDTGFMEFNLPDIANIIDVQHASGREILQDADSIELFGNRLFILDNNLLPDAATALIIGDFILSLKKDAGNIFKMDLSLTYPDVFKILFGDPIEVVEPFHGINNIYNVLEKTIKVSKNKVASLNMKCRKFVFPPAVDSYILEPFQDDALISMNSNTGGFLEGFKVTTDGSLLKMTYKVKLTVLVFFQFNALLAELDGSGFPTGSILGVSNSVRFFAGAFDDIIEITFPEGERPTLVTSKTYGVAFNNPSPSGRFTDLQVRGKNTNVYADGKPAEKVGTWSTLHPKDIYFKAEIGQ